MMMRKLILGSILSLTAVFAASPIEPPPVLPIPEPQSYLLIGLGLAAIGLIGTKRTTRDRK